VRDCRSGRVVALERHGGSGGPRLQAGHARLDEQVGPAGEERAVSTLAIRWVGADGTVQTRTGSSIEPYPATEGWVWIDITAPDEPMLAELCRRFNFHTLAIEDVRHPQARPKLDIYPEGLFLAWLAPHCPEGDGIAARELDVFISREHLITIHAEKTAVIDVISADVQRSMGRGPDWLLHAIIDRLVDDTLPLVDEVGEQLGMIEDAMLAENPRQDELRSLHQVRRQLVRMHRIIAPERDILRSFARESEVIGEDAYRYFQDVGDHVARVLDAIETYQDVGASVMDVYLSAQNNRMNEIMKQLTVVATIFMPLTLLSGIYGMNVLAGMWPPPLAWWSFPFVVGSMVAIALVMATYFRKKKWW
jgi:magnesium transporter